MTTLNVITGFVRSLEYMLICFTRGPLLPFVSTLVFICPTAPGSRWLELTTAAVQPQEGTTRSMVSGSFPAFRTVKT